MQKANVRLYLKEGVNVPREQMSEHFYRDEFACKGEHCCNGSAPISEKLIDGLESFRKALSSYVGEDTPVHINSGFRCKKHNTEEGGEDESEHTNANAVDVSSDVPVVIMYECALNVDVFRGGGIGLYSNRLHLDVGRKRRW
ncbi:D-Ala-D-Ala carboxypeptidase family metallohydrolase [Candidatus Venteria ishoeyi]|uniref:D-Ala-D-Ala carboxypeptidase family metallohydrolase n=1 Tax=Candidatus Venteria ishoeyi TaxID=1899563 RepID=UPI0025A596C2|nr:D-Ala-D-Ala carboxypeptidase family metallohydrolase [Candidatus Venteria ishoeyi]MDM8548288.1 D-Ala-D-Ala carboxypeptidase family metallohydrolase [Candidatus Venteria ishoeyi]